MVGSPQTSGSANGAELQPYLVRTDFPCERDELARLVAERGAPRRVVETIERLPAQRYDEPGDVLEAVRELDGSPERTLLADEGATRG